MNFARAASQKKFSIYKLSLHNKTFIIQNKMTKNIRIFVAFIFYFRAVCEMIRLLSYRYTILWYCRCKINHVASPFTNLALPRYFDISVNSLLRIFTSSQMPPHQRLIISGRCRLFFYFWLNNNIHLHPFMYVVLLIDYSKRDRNRGRGRVW